MGVIRLEPTAPRIIDQQWKREVAGYCLVWDPLGRTLSLTPPERRLDRGWKLDVGPGLGQVQAIVHVTGAWPNEMLVSYRLQWRLATDASAVAGALF